MKKGREREYWTQKETQRKRDRDRQRWKGVRIHCDMLPCCRRRNSIPVREKRRERLEERRRQEEKEGKRQARKWTAKRRRKGEKSTRIWRR